ncbi:MAG: FKBP-type peptidyl-prolyl cis-trans isomerase [Chitinophagaceae bacterium]
MFKTIILSSLLVPCFVMAQPGKKNPAKTPTKIPMAVKSSTPSPLKTTLDSFSYAIGTNIGFNLKQSGIDKINSAMIVKAFDDVMKGRQPLMDMQTSNGVVNAYFAPIAAKKAKALKEPGEKFLAENKKRPGIISLPNGLQYEILKAGNGPKPVDSNSVKVDYSGTFTDGKPFDSSIGKAPYEVNMMGGVIKGWLEILKLMPVGSKWKVYIPSDLAYGDQGRDGIPPGSVLVFELDLISISK